MKWIFTGLAGLLALGHAEAISLHIQNSSLGEPFYRSVSKLRMTSENSESGNVSIKFIGPYETILESKENIKIRKSDYQDCSNGFCSVSFFELPLSIEKFTCEIEVKFATPAGQILLSNKEKWGDCANLPPSPDRKYLPDFIFPETAYFSEQGEIEIQNVGASFNQKNISVWGFLKDSEGKIIWSGIYRNVLTFNSQQSLMLAFDNLPKAWQNHLACSGDFYIDPEFNFFERGKLNNHIQMEYGNCEEIPSEISGDRIDFEPLAAFSNGVLTLQARNNGRLPYLTQTTSLETKIRFFGSGRQLIFKKDIFTGPDIYGFGDVKHITQSTVPDGTCYIELELNPNLTIKESNYINNRIELKVCE